jgi:hypothetical protein
MRKGSELMIQQQVYFFSPSSADPLSNMLLQFDSAEEAIAFAVRNGKLLTS